MINTSISQYRPFETSTLCSELYFAKLNFLSDLGIENAPSFFAIILLKMSLELAYEHGLGAPSFFKVSKPLSFLGIENCDFDLIEERLLTLSADS
jgi:hypothetical protein